MIRMLTFSIDFINCLEVFQVSQPANHYWQSEINKVTKKRKMHNYIIRSTGFGLVKALAL